ncbi:gag-pol fusion protein SKDI_07G3580 [Saccharomyces kudriavzevii IFO 1802]|nr:uncharacterized protein SKDI_07G3580 [Saccharomyces kudriavzevii IFO 1802]CAI4062432.1 hypothetical protein SKDI_07G3580 [Saccharomyces kudriavzevii IFO 1802]
MDKTAEKYIKIKNTKIRTLFDSGSPTSFIQRDTVKLLNLPIHDTPPLRFRGFISTESATTSEAVTLDLTVDNLQFNVAAYVLDKMDYQLLIGNPILRRYPKLLYTILNTKQCTSAQKPKAYHPENINYVKVKCAGNRGNSRTKTLSFAPTTPEATDLNSAGNRGKPRNNNLSFAPTIPDATDLKSAGNRGDSRTNTLSFAPTIPDATDPLTTLDNPGSIHNTFAQFQIPEEAMILEEDERYFNVVSTIHNVEPKAIDHSDKEPFSTLPAWLQQKYTEIIRNDLPARCMNIDNAPVKHDIEIKPDARLPRLQPYHVTEKNERIINKIVQELLDNRFIVPSKSPCSSPVVLVPKKDGTFRLCVDYRALNKITISDPFPLPRIDNLLSRIGNAQIFTTLDLHSGYHQIPMEPKDRYKTAFVTPSGKYEYTVMPFGLVNAPSTFARYMADIFRDLRFVNVYLDDILIFSESQEEHWKHLDTVLERLKKENLIVKKKKCKFASKQIEFLGYSIGIQRIAPLQHKCAAIRDFPTPKTVKQAQRFLGMINYYRRFIPECSKIAQPIQLFICDKSQWTEEQDKAIEKLKTALCSSPVLIPFDSKATYRLTTDASKDGIGAVLEEINTKNKLIGVVGYFSKTLEGAQKNYPAGELELLGIIKALHHFRYMLHGKHFTLRTDHISLLSLQNKNEPARRVQRWLDDLATYEFTLEYLAGPKNVVADAISRAVYTTFPETPDPINPESWKTEYKSDPLCSATLIHLNELTQHNVKPEDMSAFHSYRKKFQLSETFRKNYSIVDEIIYYRDRLVVPVKQQNEVIKLYHDHTLFGGHFGVTVTFGKIAPIYYWPKLQHSITQYIRTCVQCQLTKSHRPRSQGLLQPLPVAEGRWLNISMDFVTGLPLTTNDLNMILVVVDRFSKRAHFIATRKTADASQLINTLFRYIFSYHGFPKTITSDRDIRITAEKYQELTKRLGIKSTMSSANHPQTDGQSERTIQTLNRLLRAYASTNTRNWHTYLPQIEFVYNSTPTRTLGKSPFEIDLGYTPNAPTIKTDCEINARSFTAVELARHLKAITIQTKERLESAQIEMETNNNQRRKTLLLNIGDHVLVHRDAYFKKGAYMKVQPIYVGPFRVVKKINDNAYELDLDSHKRKHRVINVQYLKKFVYRPDAYPKNKPISSVERINRANEVIAVIGIDTTHKTYLCRMQDVDPTISVEYSEAEFYQIPEEIRKSILANFRQLYETQDNSEREEDVVSQNEIPQHY